jgi:hypothetical protein
MVSHVFGSKTRYHRSSTVVSNATQRGPRYRIDEVLPCRQHHSLDNVYACTIIETTREEKNVK